MTSRLLNTLLLLLGASTLLLRAASPEPKLPEATLKVGHPAPPILSGEWVQGEPVKKFEPGKAYLVEFWATWCGPCRVSIPHLNELHNKYKTKGLVVIGQDCWERDEKLVANFIAKMSDKMSYRVALDDKRDKEKGAMAETWMAAAGRSGIPSAFLVNTKGIIAWIGHPMSLKETLIEEVLAGTFNVEKAAQDYAAEQKTEQQLRPVQQAISRAILKKDWQEATAKLDEAAKLLPPDKQDNLAMTRLTVLLGQQNYPKAYQFAENLSDTHKDNPGFQNTLAWRLATDKSIAQPNLVLAEKIALRANDASGGKDPQILDTLALIKFKLDFKAEAVRLQEKAVALAGPNQQAALQKTLELYKKGELPPAN